MGFNRSPTMVDRRCNAMSAMINNNEHSPPPETLETPQILDEQGGKLARNGGGFFHIKK